MADSHLRLDVASVISDVGAIGINKRGPDLHLARSRDELRKRLDVREPPGLTLSGGMSRGQQAQGGETQAEVRGAGATPTRKSTI